MFYKRTWQAIKGRKAWLQLIKNYNITQKDYIIIETTKDQELIAWGNQYLDQFVKKHHIRKIIILRQKGRKIGLHYPKAKYIEYSRDRIENIIALYCMYYFSNRLLIFDTAYPDTNKLEKLILNKILTKQEIVAIGLFGLESVKRNVT